MSSVPLHLVPDQVKEYHERGFLVVRELLQPVEVQLLIDTFMNMHAAGQIPGGGEPDEHVSDIFFERYPRMVHPHRVSGTALQYLLDPRIATCLTDLLGEEPLAAQSMFYFKQPGARGHALHQDNFFVQVEPGTCIAAWIALDVVDRENGGLEMVPGSHAMNIFCPETDADQKVSSTREVVPIPPGLKAEGVDMMRGDVVFFNGTIIHGSPENRTPDRFRRSFVGHYIGRSAKRVSLFYHPVLNMAGVPVAIEKNLSGGPCGTEGANH